MVQAAIKPKPVTRSAEVEPAGDPIVLHLPEGLLTDELLIDIAILNEPLRFERSREGALEISPPPATLSGRRGGRIFVQLLAWSDATQNGESFPSGSGFSLPIGSARDADSAWVSNERLGNADTDSEGLWQVCPDLIIEVRSRSQAICKQQEKMDEWMSAGARLGWLIDVYTDVGRVWVYREGVADPERLDRPDTLSGEDVAEGLVVDLTRLWR